MTFALIRVASPFSLLGGPGGVSVRLHRCGRQLHAPVTLLLFSAAASLVKVTARVSVHVSKLGGTYYGWDTPRIYLLEEAADCAWVKQLR